MRVPVAHSDNYGTSEYWFIDKNESEDKDCFLTSHYFFCFFIFVNQFNFICPPTCKNNWTYAMTHRYFNHWMHSAKSTGSRTEPKEIRYLSEKWPS